MAVKVSTNPSANVRLKQSGVTETQYYLFNLFSGYLQEEVHFLPSFMRQRNSSPSDCRPCSVCDCASTCPIKDLNMIASRFLRSGSQTRRKWNIQSRPLSIRVLPPLQYSFRLAAVLVWFSSGVSIWLTALSKPRKESKFKTTLFGNHIGLFLRSFSSKFHHSPWLQNTEEYYLEQLHHPLLKSWPFWNIWKLALRARYQTNGRYQVWSSPFLKGNHLRKYLQIWPFSNLIYLILRSNNNSRFYCIGQSYSQYSWFWHFSSRIGGVKRLHSNYQAPEKTVSGIIRLVPFEWLQTVRNLFISVSISSALAYGTFTSSARDWRSKRKNNILRTDWMTKISMQSSVNVKVVPFMASL